MATQSTPLRTLYLDLNAFFASVEQQENPSLRGRPVGVTPLDTESTCCIAASYEARAFGVRTGTSVREARGLCPGITLVAARPTFYIKVHHAIKSAVERVLPVAETHSIDEFSCRLLGPEREPSRAIELARDVKRSIREHVGDALRCSVGVAPNRVLAKLASNRRKPDGLTVIHGDDLPGCLFDLDLTDLPGVAEGTAARLARHGVTSVEALAGLSQKQMRTVWGSVWGEYWWCWLRGEDVHPPEGRRRSFSNQHIMDPGLRTEAGARSVVMRLTHKVASRLRWAGYLAGELHLGVRFEDGSRWSGDARFEPGDDTVMFSHAVSDLWERMLR